MKWYNVIQYNYSQIPFFAKLQQPVIDPLCLDDEDDKVSDTN